MAFWRMRRQAIAAILVSVLAACTAPQDLTLPSTAQKIPAEELRGLFVDKTHRGEVFLRGAGRFGETVMWVEYFSPDGRATVRQRSAIRHGTWEIRGDTVCFDYIGGSGEACYYAHRDDSTIYAVRIGGRDDGKVTNTIFSIEDGNTDKLPLR